MSDNDIFGNTNTDNSSQGNDNTSTDDIFTNMVGEDKQYKSPQDLAKGKVEADAFITQIQDENKGLRDELDKRLSAEEILQKVKDASTTEQANTNAISEDKLAELIKGTVQNLDSQKTASGNLAAASQLMINKYGDKSTEMLAMKANELGLSVENLKDTASRSPLAFAQMLGLETTKPDNSTNHTDGTMNTQAFDAQNGNHRGPETGTYAYYEKMRKENTREYFSPAIQNEMFQKRKELGDKFFA